MNPQDAAPTAPLEPRITGDGTFSLYCPATGEGFHSADGARGEARRVFLAPARLDRFPQGSSLRVVEVAVGTGTNTVALVEGVQALGLELQWWGLELDSRPLALALAAPTFRRQWSPPALAALKEMVASERILWGDARQRLADLPVELAGRCDLVLLDAFSPQRCPQLWSQEFLSRLAALLGPTGRLLTYCCAAAVRRALLQTGLHLAALPGACSGRGGSRWSGGTAASPTPLVPGEPGLFPLSAMELEHIASRAGEPYLDPSGQGSRAELLARRRHFQAVSTAEPASRWRRRWGLAVRR